MVLTVSVALLSVISVGVSTFAWFQANADVNIETASDSTTITVSKPDEYTFYYYNGNHNGKDNEGTSLSGGFSYGTVTGGGDSVEDFNTDFTAVTSSSFAKVTSFSNFNPGEKLTFAIKVDNVQNVSLTISKLISTSAYEENNSKHRYIGNNSTDVNISEAIDIFSTYNTSDAIGYSSFITSPSGDKFSVTSSEAESTLAYSSISNHKRTLSTPINIFNVTSSTLTTKKTVYVFYTVSFSNASATLYKEFTNSSHSVEAIVPRVDEDLRYFMQNSGGTSNCYSGLHFALSELELRQS